MLAKIPAPPLRSAFVVRVAILIFGAALLRRPPGAAAQTLAPLRLTNPAPADVFFGWKIMVSGDYAVVWGVTESFLFRVSTGALVRTFGGWIFAIDGERILLFGGAGANLIDLSTGALLVSLVDPSSGSFGDACAISKNRALVGAPNDHFPEHEGSAYLFDLSTGALVQTLRKPQLMNSDHFGDSCALSSDYAAASAPFPDTGELLGSGEVFVFKASDGSLLYSLSHPQPRADGRFGSTIAISDGKLLVGASGMAFLYEAATGALLRTFHSVPGAWNGFGRNVAILNNRVLIGAPAWDTPYTDGGTAGAAYLFEATSGALLRIFANPPSPPTLFGEAVALTEGHVLVGDPYYSDASFYYQGRAYVYPIPDAPIREFLLGLHNDPTGLDLNEDSARDIADELKLFNP